MGLIKAYSSTVAVLSETGAKRRQAGGGDGPKPMIET